MKQDDKFKKKVATVMREYASGKLKSGSGQKVASKEQAAAIAYSEARKMTSKK